MSVTAPQRRRLATPIERPGREPAGVPALAEVMGRAAGENFTVASRLLPRAARSDLLSVYAFARTVDELGDSAPGDRGALLDWASAEVRRALDGGPSHPAFAGVAELVRRRGLDRKPLEDLIEANRRDQTMTRYQTFEELVGYCALSANPVGRLVLGALGVNDDGAVALSDSVCTGLQLVEHWQDVTEDAGRGRVYLPADDMGRFGVVDADLLASPTPEPLRALLAFENARARRLLVLGAPLARRLSGRAAWAVAGFVGGGLAAADALAAADYNVAGAHCRPRPRRVAHHVARVLAGRRL